LLKQLFAHNLYRVFIEFIEKIESYKVTNSSGSKENKSFEVFHKILDVYAKTEEIEHETKLLDLQQILHICYQTSLDKFKLLVEQFKLILPIINNQSCFDLLIQSPNNLYDHHTNYSNGNKLIRFLKFANYNGNCNCNFFKIMVIN
jgi:hypothetical protein